MEHLDEDFDLGDIEEDPVSERLEETVELSAEEQFEMPLSHHNSIAHCTVGDATKFPGHIKPKEDMSIGDVVKDNALSFLPAKSLCRFKVVSKAWNKWIGSPFLAHNQTNSFKNIYGLFCQNPVEGPFFVSLDPKSCGVPDPSLDFLPGPVSIRTSCNGLLCCQGHFGDYAYYVCNPVTKLWTELPKPNYYHGRETAIALFFEPSVLQFNANFELICCVVAFPNHPFRYFEIYSSRTNSWREGKMLCCDLDALYLKGDGFYMKGFVYWETWSQAVLAFDVKEEEYGIIRLPPSSGQNGALTNMHGELCYLLPARRDDALVIEVYGNMDMSLKCVISLNAEDPWSGHRSFRALSFVNDDTLILSLGTDLIAYHVRSKKAQRLGNATCYGDERYLPYVNSLVHIHVLQ